MPNAALAQRILDQVTSHPDHFVMSSWFDGPELTLLPAQDPIDCGTTMCIAGWACHLAGYGLADTIDGVMAVDSAGANHPLGDKARQLLDLPDIALFHVADEQLALEMLRQIVDGRDLSVVDAQTAVYGP